MFVHHNRRVGGSNGEDVLGSAAFAASKDTILSLDWPSGSGPRILCGFGRDGVSLERIGLCRNRDNNWVSRGGSGNGREDASRAAAIAAYLKERHGSAGPEDQIIRDLGSGRTAALDAFRRIRRRGLVVRTGQGCEQRPTQVLSSGSEPLGRNRIRNPNPIANGDNMSDRENRDDIEALIEALKPLIDALPQPDPASRLAAVYHAVADAAGLDKESTTRALAIFATGLHQAHASVEVHHRDGSIEAFTDKEFRFDIRPDSPYFDKGKVN